MKRNAALTWSYLHILTFKRYEAVLKAYGSLEEGLIRLNADLLKSLGCTDETIHVSLERLKEFNVSVYEKSVQQKSVSFCAIDNKTYPTILKNLPDPPVFLYAKGDMTLCEEQSIALVGTRKMSAYGKKVVKTFVDPLVRAGLTTVSGLADGIDGEVARETMSSHGKHIAVLGHGLDMVYPYHHEDLAREIVKSGGLLLSEYPLDIKPSKYTFPARNRIVAGLSLGTVVFEAPEKSGALITADLALQYGREVFCIPGQIFDPNSSGCHTFIAKGQARLVQSVPEILEELGLEAQDIKWVRV